MIGFFDSGFGGLLVAREFLSILPGHDIIYLGDSKRCPYGDLDPTTIRKYTQQGVDFLFRNGAKIVILACNTATAHSIRYLQQERFPEKKILGVTIPGAEKIAEAGYRRVGVLATPSSVEINAYKSRVHILDQSITVQEIAAPDIVPLIEKGFIDTPHIVDALKTHVQKFEPNIEALVLGCTHYPCIVHHLRAMIGNKIDIIDPGKEAAKKFLQYLDRHRDIDIQLGKSGKMQFFTTGDKQHFASLGKKISGLSIEVVETIEFLGDELSVSLDTFV